MILIVKTVIVGAVTRLESKEKLIWVEDFTRTEFSLQSSNRLFYLLIINKIKSNLNKINYLLRYLHYIVLTFILAVLVQIGKY